MNVCTFRHDSVAGWSVDHFPAVDSERTIVLAFGGSDFLDDRAVIDELTAAYPESHVIGCSTSGEILGNQLRDGTLTVAAAQFEHTDLRSAAAPLANAEESYECGRRLATELAGEGLRAVIVLSNGRDVNGSELIRGLRAALPMDTVVTGGLAGDADRFKRTWVLVDGRPQERFARAIGLYGDRVQIGHGCEGGWDPFGPERVITKSDANVLLELDGRPALELYKTYLGDEATGLPATALLYPLAVRVDDVEFVRTVLDVDESRQSMTFAGDIPEGARARFMTANTDRLIEGAAESARRSRHASGTPVLALAVSCVGRRLVMGERTDEELEAVLAELPAGSNLVGFYSYGEISPAGFGPCSLHNQTMTLTSIFESGPDAQAA